MKIDSSPLRDTHQLPTSHPVMQVKTVIVIIFLITLVISSFISLNIDWHNLFSEEAANNIKEFISGFVPPDLSAPLLKKVFFAALETLAMSALGTAIAAIIAIILALPASGRFGRIAKYSNYLLFNLCRAIPELVWASIMLIAAGLGPFAGTIALAAHTTGVLGRLFAESLENLPDACESTLRINGSSTIAAFLYAALPQGLPQMMSYTLYRWENNIRAAAILGVVGAGGLGQMLKYHLSLFQMPTAATVIIAMLLLVALVDALSFTVRRRLMH
ncbi:phosphonate ABC transporter, permease protein PhnE [Undibacterium sp. RuRC25W]|uniref:phosphonate ABC transporter, permease protein PhnE n=1 Tax=Undibacterium sp. RuRC25W TaxID=3413047 RepID=UPI003BF09921